MIYFNAKAAPQTLYYADLVTITPFVTLHFPLFTEAFSDTFFDVQSYKKNQNLQKKSKKFKTAVNNMNDKAHTWSFIGK